jgi:SAM-dependent methyltransferase
MKCRHCKTDLRHQVLDLGFSPPSNSFLTRDQLSQPEVAFPLRVYVCDNCWLIQTADFVDENMMFPETYVYFSSTSQSWMEHAKNYVEMIVERLSLTVDSSVIEIASNDGYLLRNFNDRGIPNFGIEPTRSTAEAAERIGVQTVQQFFGAELVNELLDKGVQADLVIGNNVYAHVPDINDFTLAISRILKPNGVVTLEFPHAENLILKNQFDTVYHEHFSYLSLIAVQKVFTSNGLRVFDVDEIDTHGGSLRIYGCRFESGHLTSPKVEKIIESEITTGLNELRIYRRMQERALSARRKLLQYLFTCSENSRNVVAYGAAAKGNTFLNFASVTKELLPVVFDAATSKQGKFLPGCHIPVLHPDAICDYQPDEVLILPWNISDEVRSHVSQILGYQPNFVDASSFCVNE